MPRDGVTQITELEDTSVHGISGSGPVPNVAETWLVLKKRPVSVTSVPPLEGPKSGATLLTHGGVYYKK
jgi:hypothetical protein